MAKPSTTTGFLATGLRAVLPLAKKIAGFAAGETIAEKFLNELFANIEEWLAYIDTDLLTNLQLDGFVTTAQGTPDNTVAVSAGRTTFGKANVAYAGGNSGTFAARDTTNDRIDLLYLDSAGALQIVTGTAAASPVAPHYRGRFVIAEVTITADAGGGAAVIEQADIKDVRMVTTASAIVGAVTGRNWLEGAKVTSYQDATNFVIGVNCDAEYFNLASSRIDAGFEVGKFDTGVGIIVLVLNVSSTVQQLRVFRSSTGWTDDGVTNVTLLESINTGNVSGTLTHQIYNGTTASLEDIADKSGGGGSALADATGNITGAIRNHNVTYKGGAAFTAQGSTFQYRRAGTGDYRIQPPAGYDTNSFRVVCAYPNTADWYLSIARFGAAEWRILSRDGAGILKDQIIHFSFMIG